MERKLLDVSGTQPPLCEAVVNMNLLSFKLHSHYFISLSLSVVGHIWSQILSDRLQVCKEKEKFIILCFRPP